MRFMTVTENLRLAFQWDTATAAIERVEFTAEDKVVEEHLAVTAGGCAESMRAASPLSNGSSL